MNFTLIPFLEHIALVKVVTTLWSQDDIRALLVKFDFPLWEEESREKWRRIEREVAEKVRQLPQPKTLKDKILGFIMPIGFQIFKWLEYHRENNLLDIFLNEMNFSFPNALCWTPQGTIDKKKTAKVLTKNENLHVFTRYKLACIYCLEDDIPKLWENMPESLRKSFYGEEYPREVRQQELVVFWTNDMKEEINNLGNMIDNGLHSPYQYAFENAAASGNKSATKYFFQKLTSKERYESLVRSAGNVANRRCVPDVNHADLPKEQYADVLCFLLSQMEEEQQMEVFKSHPYKVLKCLLDWPWQSLFMTTANRMWDFLAEENYYLSLKIIVCKIRDGYMDCNYRNLFREFWQQSPNANQSYVTGHKASSAYLLSELFKIQDEENIKLILKNATPREKEKIIFHHNGMRICENLLYSNKWDSLKFFVQDCISSKEAIFKFKKEFKRSLSFGTILKKVYGCSGELEWEKGQRNKFFRFLNDLAKVNRVKRSTDGGESSQVKRLHSAELEDYKRCTEK